MRPLTATDARDMASLHAQSFERPWDALEMAAHVARDLCFGVEDKSGQLAGFIILSRAADQAEILTIATAKSARRQGWGRTLLDGAIAELRTLQVSELFLEVAEYNSAALALYRSAGFDPIGRRPAYYRRAAGRVAAITFSKKL
jgi:ribosomal-protein-alanine N-acetyltransferase